MYCHNCFNFWVDALSNGESASARLSEQFLDGRLAAQHWQQQRRLLIKDGRDDVFAVQV